MNLTDALKELGLTNQEALLFLELCRSNGITGYEAAKSTGISRSNAYSSLASLADKGFAYTIHGEPIRYMAMSKFELLQKIRQKQANTLDFIDENLTQMPIIHEPYYTYQGKEQILSKMSAMINQANLRLYLSASTSIIECLKAELANAQCRNLKVVLLTDVKDSDLSAVYYQRTSNNKSIKLIVDTAEILAGSIEQALYSKNPTFVSIIRESLIYEITLIENNMFPII